MTEQRVSSRYATAILETAKLDKLEDKIYEDLNYVSKVINVSKDFKTVLKSPIIYHWQKKNIFKDLFEEKISPLAFKFMLLLIDKKREALLDSIIKNYFAKYDELKNRLRVDVVSASELDDSIKSKINTKLEEYTKKTIICNFRINKDLKGGLQIQIDDWVFDASIKTQLELLRQRLADNLDII